MTLGGHGDLSALGITSRYQWDTLVFLYRHRISLLSSEDIARLLGYPTGPIVLALESLESLGLVLRSRSAQGVRLYQQTLPGDPRRAEALHRLLSLAGERSARLGLFEKLGRDYSAEDPPGSRRGEEERGNSWPKLIESRRASSA